jgi:hypothetical protein
MNIHDSALAHGADRVEFQNPRVTPLSDGIDRYFVQVFRRNELLQGFWRLFPVFRELVDCLPKMVEILPQRGFARVSRFSTAAPTAGQKQD